MPENSTEAIGPLDNSVERATRARVSPMVLCRRSSAFSLCVPTSPCHEFSVPALPLTRNVATRSSRYREGNE